MKFTSLLKKELKELLTPQVFIGMLVMVVLLLMMGSMMGSVVDNAIQTTGATVYDMDNTDFTKKVLSETEKNNIEISYIKSDSDNFSEIMQQNNISSLIVIPKGFTDSLTSVQTSASIKVINTVTTTSISGVASSETSSQIVNQIASAVKTELLKNYYNIPLEKISIIEEPILVSDVTIVGDKSADVSASAISAFSMMQSIIVPVLILILVIFTSQMMMSSIATEKIDKTFETLLSAPISRMSILMAKMVATTIVALINVVVYMIGFGGMMTSMGATAMMSPNISSAVTDVSQTASEMSGISAALSALGLQMSIGNYVMLGIQMFLTIMITLSVSLILGSMATDAKSIQSLSLPIMLCTMFPYLVTLFADMNTLSPILKVILYVIPFTHTFITVDNLLFGHIGIYWAGLAYQIIFLIVCMFIAVKLFNSDKIFTASFNFTNKRKKAVSKEN